ncbi:hypothetical protein R6Q59_032421 [Mikania micrantha]
MHRKNFNKPDSDTKLSCLETDRWGLGLTAWRIVLMKLEAFPIYLCVSLAITDDSIQPPPTDRRLHQATTIQPPPLRRHHRVTTIARWFTPQGMTMDAAKP